MVTFAGTRVEQYRQAANAVPLNLVAHLTGHLREAVLERDPLTV